MANDVIGNAVRVMRVATGQVPSGQVQTAKYMGAKGGKARAANLSPERRREIARKAAQARWGKAKE